jgi:pyruvate dehydrogenase (quinone)
MHTVSDQILQRLHEWGVDTVFGYPGDGINGLLTAWPHSTESPMFVQSRHEEMSAFEAVGYAKFSGRLGVCLATSGPGAIHLLNGLYDAKLDHVPVLALVGQTSRSAIGSSYQQEVDLAALLGDVAAYRQVLTVPQQLPHVLDRAVRVALTERTPTAVIVPADVLDLEWRPPGRAPKMVPSSLGLTRRISVPDSVALQEAADVLNTGQRVAILVGQGARGAEDEVTAVAEVLGAGVAKALLGKDALPDDLPWVTGSIGLLGSEPTEAMMRNCDTLLTIGSSFPYSEHLPDPSRARGVQIDVDGKAIGMRFPYDVCLVGDARATLGALLPRLVPTTNPGWRESIEESVRDWWEVLEREALAEAPPINPQRLFHEASRVLPDNVIVAADSGSGTTWYARHLRFRSGMRGSLSGTLASMGSAVPYAIGAKAAFPDRPVIAFAGDGAMQMNGLAELITVKRYWESWADPRFVVAVLHNNDLNMVTWEMRALQGSPKLEATQDLPDVDYAAFAANLGMYAVTVEDPDDVAPAWESALAAGRPALLDVRCSADVPPTPPRPSLEQVRRTTLSLVKGDPDTWGILAEALRVKVDGLFPNHREHNGGQEGGHGDGNGSSQRSSPRSRRRGDGPPWG